MFELTISNMPARNKQGWVKQNETFCRASSQNSYGASAQKLTYLLEDGIYEVQDANFGSRRTNRYWLKVENGEGFEIEKPKSSIVANLPKLQGSEKQIAWAESIREKAIAATQKSLPIPTSLAFPLLLKSCYPSSWESAKFWIDYRDTVTTAISQWVKKELQNSIYSYPEKRWVDYAEEYAHEGKGGEWAWYCKGLKSEAFSGEGDDLTTPVFCQNPESQEWEIWHYIPSIY